MLFEFSCPTVAPCSTLGYVSRKGDNSLILFWKFCKYSYKVEYICPPYRWSACKIAGSWGWTSSKLKLLEILLLSSKPECSSDGQNYRFITILNGPSSSCRAHFGIFMGLGSTYSLHVSPQRWYSFRSRTSFLHLRRTRLLALSHSFKQVCPLYISLLKFT